MQKQHYTTSDIYACEKHVCALDAPALTDLAPAALLHRTTRNWLASGVDLASKHCIDAN